jgi:NAD+ kinase
MLWAMPPATTHPIPAPRVDGAPGPRVRRAGLVLRPERDLSGPLDEVRAWADDAGVALVGAEDEPRLPRDVERRADAELAAGCDAVIALGGDGTMLGAMRLAAPHDVPVMGVNLGTLGYLTEIDAAHLRTALSAIADGAYTVESRTALTLAAGDGIEAQVVYNDVVVTRVPGRGQAKLALRIDGELLVRYASDGVIAATPQGSTAYAFAAGGPLVSPRAQGMIVMPDAPHGLFNRAVVLADGERLGIELLPRSAPVSLERDGRLFGHVEPGARLEIQGRPDAAWVVRVYPGGFAERARRKLGITDPAGMADFDLAGHER